MATIAPRYFWLKDGTRLTVRLAELDDARSLLALGAANVAEEEFSVTTPDEFQFTEDQERDWISSFLQPAAHLLLVGEVDGAIVGLMGFQCSPRQRLRHHGTLHLGVARGWRRKGVATALMGTVLDWATAHPQIEKVALEVLADNAPAIALYRRFGFREQGRRPREVKRGPDSYVDDVLMYRFVEDQ